MFVYMVSSTSCDILVEFIKNGILNSDIFMKKEELS